MAPARTFCEPMVCWVQPNAYMMVAARLGVAVDANIAQTCRNFSCGEPQTRATISGV